MPIKDQTRSWSLFIINIRQLSVISAGFPCCHLDGLHITWSRKQICRAKKEWVRYFPLLKNKYHQKIKESALRTFRIYMLLRLASGKDPFISIFNMDHATNATRLSNATLTDCGSVQLCCFHQNGKVKCTARIRVAVKNALIIKNVGKRVSKEKNKNKTKPIFKINWELPEATNPKKLEGCAWIGNSTHVQSGSPVLCGPRHVQIHECKRLYWKK